VKEWSLSRVLASGRWRPVLIVLGIGTFLAILGPFGSSGLGWPWAWFYWTGLIGFGALFGFGTGYWLPRLAPNLPVWLTYGVAILVVSAPVTVAVLAMNTGFYANAPSLTMIAINYGSVVVISAFVTTVAYVVDRLNHSAAAAVAPQAGGALLDKLPPRLRRATLTSMTAEDHYLRVRTDAGEALILMRLSDAVAACEALDGARTHRSWWVARHTVVDAQKGDGRGLLVLADGTEAPVSRTYYPALREAGWF